MSSYYGIYQFGTYLVGVPSVSVFWHYSRRKWKSRRQIGHYYYFDWFLFVLIQPMFVSVQTTMITPFEWCGILHTNIHTDGKGILERKTFKFLLSLSLSLSHSLSYACYLTWLCIWDLVYYNDKRKIWVMLSKAMQVSKCKVICGHDVMCIVTCRHSCYHSLGSFASIAYRW